MEKRFYGIPVVPIVEKEDRMSQTQDTIVAALMEQLIAEGPDGMAQELCWNLGDAVIRRRSVLACW